MKDKENAIVSFLAEIYPDARCELEYEKDYELLIATVLSAQCTDKRVNQVTKQLWKVFRAFRKSCVNGNLYLPLESSSL